MREAVLRYSVLRITLFGTVLVVPLLAILLVWSGISAEATLIACLVNVAFDAVFAFFVAWFLPVRINHAGIAGQTAMGTAIKMNWSDIESAKYFNLLGLPYWLLKSPNHKWRMWLMDLFVDNDSLETVLKEFAPEDNPLRIAVEERKRSARA